MTRRILAAINIIVLAFTIGSWFAILIVLSGQPHKLPAMYRELIQELTE